MKHRFPLLVSAGIIHRNGQVLVGQRRRSDRHPLKWEFPGGKVEFGESPQEALVRELAEELQIQAIVGSELARYEHDYPSGSRIHLLFFAVNHFLGEPHERLLRRFAKFHFAAGELPFERMAIAPAALSHQHLPVAMDDAR
jgi:mutator protein MutT